MKNVGRSAPLAATVGDGGVNFSVFSRSAAGVALLLFDRADDARPAREIRLDPALNRTYHYWHVFVPDVKPGQIYGYRAEGPADPGRGMRFDPAKRQPDWRECSHSIAFTLELRSEPLLVHLIFNAYWEALRLTLAPERLPDLFGNFEATVQTRRDEADDFYRTITPASTSEDAARVMRQALAGMLWSKQYYFLDADKWLEEHGADPFALHPRPVRNREWVT